MTKRQAQSPRTRPRMVECDDHGRAPGCLICTHLGDGRVLGYWAIKPADTRPAQAWCDDCDAVLEQERGWSDRACAAADWQIYCAICYDRALKRHKRLGWLPGVRPESPTKKRPSRPPRARK